MLIDILEIIQQSAELYFANFPFLYDLFNRDQSILLQLSAWVIVTFFLAYGLGKYINISRFSAFYLKFNWLRIRLAFLLTIGMLITLIAHPLIPIFQNLSMHALLTFFVSAIAICCFAEFKPLIDYLKNSIIKRNKSTVLFCLIFMLMIFGTQWVSKYTKEFSDVGQFLFGGLLLLITITISVPSIRNRMRQFEEHSEWISSIIGYSFLTFIFFILPIVPLFVPEIEFSGSTYSILVYDRILIGFCLYYGIISIHEKRLPLSTSSAWVMFALFIGNGNAILWDIVVWINQLQPTLDQLVIDFNLPVPSNPSNPVSDPETVSAFWDDMKPQNEEIMLMNIFFSLEAYFIIFLNLLLPKMNILPLYPNNPWEGKTLTELDLSIPEQKYWSRYWTLSYIGAETKASIELIFFEDGSIGGTQIEPTDDKVFEFQLYGTYKEDSGMPKSINIWAHSPELLYRIHYQSSNIIIEDEQIQIQGFWLLGELGAGHFVLENKRILL